MMRAGNRNPSMRPRATVVLVLAAALAAGLAGCGRKGGLEPPGAVAAPAPAPTVFGTAPPPAPPAPDQTPPTGDFLLDPLI